MTQANKERSLYLFCQTISIDDCNNGRCKLAINTIESKGKRCILDDDSIVSIDKAYSLITE